MGCWAPLNAGTCTPPRPQAATELCLHNVAADRAVLLCILAICFNNTAATLLRVQADGGWQIGPEQRQLIISYAI